MKVYIIYENPDWLGPLVEEMERMGVPYEPWSANDGSFDLAAEPPEGVFLNRMSPSSHTRGHYASVDFTRELLVWLESHGRRVINGTRAFALEISKVRQHAALRAACIATPRTIAVAGGANQLKAAARQLSLPLILKHNRGGSGRSVGRFDSLEDFDRYVESSKFEPSIDHIVLLQQYIQSVDSTITRVEIVDGELLYALRVDTSHGFDLCPAVSCQQVGDNGGDDGTSCPLETSRANRFSLIEGFNDPIVDQYIEFSRIHGLDVVGIEFITDRNGRKLTYDVNATTNYAPHIARDHGLNGPAAIASLAQRVLAESCESSNGRSEWVLPRRVASMDRP